MGIYKRFCLIVFTITTALLVVACAPGNPGSTSASNYTPQQVLERSAEAMQHITSSQFALDTTLSLSGLPTDLGTEPPADTETETAMPSELNITVTGTGVQALPEQMQLDLAITAADQTTETSQILDGENVYIQNPQDGSWYVIDRQAFEGSASNLYSGYSIDQQTLLASLQTIALEDRGLEDRNGQQLRHIHATLTEEDVKRLFDENPQLKNQFSMTDIDTLLESVQTFDSTIDLWIDEQDFYLHETQFTLNLSTATDSESTDGVTVALDMNVKLSEFNQPVDITPPAEAVPIENPEDIYTPDTPAA